jgi:hypothetical protein
MMQQPDLSQTPFRQDTLGINVGDFLDSAAFTRPTVPGSNNAPICTLAELFHILVFGIDDEGGIKGGE